MNLYPIAGRFNAGLADVVLLSGSLFGGYAAYAQPACDPEVIEFACDSLDESDTLVALTSDEEMPVPEEPAAPTEPTATVPSAGASGHATYVGIVQTRQQLLIQVSPDGSQITSISAQLWCTEMSNMSRTETITFAPDGPFAITGGSVNVSELKETLDCQHVRPLRDLLGRHRHGLAEDQLVRGRRGLRLQHLRPAFHGDPAASPSPVVVPTGDDDGAVAQRRPGTTSRREQLDGVRIARWFATASPPTPRRCRADFDP